MHPILTKGTPNDWNHEGNFGGMGPKRRNQFNMSVTDFQGHWTHKNVLVLLLNFLELREDANKVYLDKKLINPLDPLQSRQHHF
jgi:hypothetical protein